MERCAAWRDSRIFTALDHVPSPSLDPSSRTARGCVGRVCHTASAEAAAEPLVLSSGERCRRPALDAGLCCPLCLHRHPKESHTLCQLKVLAGIPDLQVPLRLRHSVGRCHCSVECADLPCPDQSSPTGITCRPSRQESVETGAAQCILGPAPAPCVWFSC